MQVNPAENQRDDMLPFSPAAFFALALLLCALSVLRTGYHVFLVNHALQIPYLKHFNNAALYPHDPLVATARHHSTMLWRGLAVVTRCLPLEPTLFALFLLERFVQLAAAGRIAAALAPRSRLALVGAMLMIASAPTPYLGSGTLVAQYVEQTGLSVAFLLLAFADFLSGRYIRWGIWTGIALNLNPLYVFYSLTYCLATFLAEKRPLAEGRTARIGAGLSVLLLVGLPLLIILLREPPQGPFDHALWLDAMRGRSALHLLPLKWPLKMYAWYAALAAAAVFVPWRMRSAPSRILRLNAAWTAVSLCWLAGAFFTAYAVPAPRLLQLQMIRGTDLWYCLIGIALIVLAADYCEGRLRESGLRPSLPAAALFCAAVFFCTLPGWRLFGGLVVLGLALFAAARIARREAGASALAFCCVVALVVVSFSRQLPVMKQQGVAGVIRTAQQIEIYPVAEWAKNHTLVRSVFLVPPFDERWEPFRSLAERSVFAEGKDGTALFYDFGYTSDWVERMAVFGWTIPPVGQKKAGKPYHDFTDADADRLAARYTLNYWIVEADHPSRFPVAAVFGHWKVLTVRPPR